MLVTRSLPARAIPRMPFPIDKRDRIGNYDGAWSLGVRCRCCGRECACAGKDFEARAWILR